MNLKLSTLFVLFVVLYWNAHLGKLLQPAYRHHHGNRSLFLYVSVYMCHVAWALIYPSAGLSASVFGDFRGCLATWIYGSGGWGRYQKPCGSWRRDPGEMEREKESVCESLQLIRSTSSSQAADLQYVPSFIAIIILHFSNRSLYHIIRIGCIVSVLRTIFRLALNSLLFKVWAQWQCARGGVEMMCVYYVLSSEKQDTVTCVWEEREREC